MVVTTTSKHALCPSCKHVAMFTCIGEQEGLDGETFSLWNCQSCGTMVSNQVLEADERKEANMKGKVVLIAIGLMLIVIYAINIVNEFANSLF